ncbi:MAG: ABC transporter permease [Cytophagales bacterium]|nr:ABC transporter permease [Cytophagales bacterium]
MSRSRNTIVRIANKLLSSVLSDKYLEEFLGDLREIHEDREKSRGRFLSNIAYWIDAIHLIFGFSSIPVFQLKQNPTIMFKHYFTVARRNLLSNKLNTFINLVGLSLGIAFTITISYIIYYELEYDKFHSHSDQIYRVVRVSQVEGETEYRTGTAWPLSPKIADEIARLDDMTYMTYWGGARIDIANSDGTTNSFQEKRGCAFVSESFFEIFDFKNSDVKWLYGSPETALMNPNSVVLTESIAQKYFPGVSPLGKSLTINQGLEVFVTGVISDLPSNTNFPFTLINSYSTLIPHFPDWVMESWVSVSDSHQTYIVLPEGMQKEELEEQIAIIHKKYAGEEFAKMRTYPLQPLSGVHRDSRFGNYQHKFTSVKNIMILGLVGAFLLIMVCINFVNISIAGSVSRSKEFGLRKAVGGSKRQIVSQLLFETFILIITGAAIALATIESIKPELQNLFNFHFDGPFISNNIVLLLILLVIVFLTFIAGMYPAWFQARSAPSVTIKQRISSRIGKSLKLSNALVLVQFTITLVLVTSTFIVLQQIRFFRSADLGFEKEAILNIGIPENKTTSLSALRNQLLQDASVVSVSYSSTIPSGLYRGRGYMDIKRKESPKEESIVYEYQSIDENYLDLYHIKLLAGHTIPSTDTSRSVIITKTLMKKLGYLNFEECIGSQADIGLKELCTVVGVIDDYYDNSLRKGYGKIAMVHDPEAFSVLNVKLESSAVSDEVLFNKSIHHIEKNWEATFPDALFHYEFLDQNIAAFYQEEARFYKIFQYLSVIVLVIGSMGIYGLITFIINKKFGEIAIRKVLGASKFDILQIILKNYLILMMVALIITIPVVFLSMEKWLENYQYHIEVEWWFFTIPTMLVLIVTSVSLINNTLRAIKLNPTIAIKHE